MLKEAIMRYSFDNFHEFVKENKGVGEMCHMRTSENLGCEGCKFESACKEFFKKE